MKQNLKKEDYDRLLEEIWRHNHLYYTENKPEISDQAFDHLLKEVEAIEKAHPEWISSDSPTQRVMEALVGNFPTVHHTNPMLSLQNTYSREEVEAFVERVKKGLGKGPHTFCCELKMDGIAFTARYQDGKFVLGATRGNGKVGDEITNNLKTIQNLPLRLKGNVPGKIEVRGEVYMPKKAFERLNQEREKENEPLWANPRNAASGSLKLLDPKEVAKRDLRVVFYGVVPDPEIPCKTQKEVQDWLKEIGFPTLPFSTIESMDDLFNYLDQVEKQRPLLPFEIDGVVIKLNSLREQEELGAAGKNPRWAVAYKFQAEQATSTVLNISVSLGRTGVLTPVADLVPTFLAGSTISRAGLHNKDEIERLDVRVGDTVVIEKGGDVIPKVVGVVSKGHRGEKWSAPTNCPSCGTPLVDLPEEVAIRCPNTAGCPEQRFRRLLFFASKQGLDIDGLGEKVMEKLVTLGFVTEPSDIFYLNKEQIAQIEGFKQKSVDNLSQAIEKAKEVTFPRLLHALGVRHVGIGTAEAIAGHFRDFYQLFDLKKEDYLIVEGVGEKVAESLADYFSNPSHQREVQRLFDAGVKLTSSQVIEDPKFLGKVFVITGTLSVSREKVGALIESRGGKVSDSLSKKTNFLVVGDSPGSKVEKAERLQVPLLSETDFLKMVDLPYLE